MFPETLETERLRLERFCHETVDVFEFYDAFAAGHEPDVDEVFEHVPQTPHRTPMDAAEMIDDAERRWEETDLFAALAVQHGIYDYDSAFGLSELTQRWDSLFDLPNEMDALSERSVIQWADSITSPTLLIGGEEDQRSPPSQSKRLYSQFERGETPAKIIIYEDMGFTALGPPHIAQDRLQQIEEWFNQVY